MCGGGQPYGSTKTTARSGREHAERATGKSTEFRSLSVTRTAMKVRYSFVSVPASAMVCRSISSSCRATAQHRFGWKVEGGKIRCVGRKDTEEGSITEQGIGSVLRSQSSFGRVFQPVDSPSLFSHITGDHGYVMF